jgi:hypothetical protein
VANQLPAPLINRLLVLEVSAPSIDEWRQWMMEHYGDQWDVRTYAFLKAFEAENYLLRPPEDPETLRNYPTPRSWTKLALMLKRGFDDPEIINGLIGPEVGTRFRAFINTNVNVDDLIKNPEKFHGLNLDQKYMASIMLSSRLKNAKDFKKAMPLFREMHKESPEFVIIMLLIMDRKTRAEAIRQIYQLDKDIFSTLVEVVELKQQAKA